MWYTAYLEEYRIYLKESTSGWRQVLPRSPFGIALLLPAAGSVGCSFPQNFSKLKRESSLSIIKYTSHKQLVEVRAQSFSFLGGAKVRNYPSHRACYEVYEAFEVIASQLDSSLYSSYFIHSLTGIVSVLPKCKTSTSLFSSESDLQQCTRIGTTK